MGGGVGGRWAVVGVGGGFFWRWWEYPVKADGPRWQTDASTLFGYQREEPLLATGLCTSVLSHSCKHCPGMEQSARTCGGKH